jgi:TATA-box binding protein (TBP) (component of TFIID and TFIIIB)
VIQIPVGDADTSGWRAILGAIRESSRALERGTNSLQSLIDIAQEQHRNVDIAEMCQVMLLGIQFQLDNAAGVLKRIAKEQEP